ncbi:hypothetical protein [Rhodococcus sp. 05-2255-1e]|uniref:hypothetical protein n=1 Tax=Rhodococcus sp. 05-2255-1e TaxID=2022495 RepID=UPI00211B6B56|nr:hypothetical protein [Rhodococcus sp. 05-2255-1e]
MPPLLIVAVLPWALSLLLGFGADRIDRRLNPSTAVVLLPVLSVVTAFSLLASLTALAAVFLTTSRAVWVTLGIVICAWAIWRSVEVARHVRRVIASTSIASECGGEARTRAASSSLSPRFPTLLPSPPAEVRS